MHCSRGLEPMVLCFRTSVGTPHNVLNNLKLLFGFDLRGPVDFATVRPPKNHTLVFAIFLQ